MKKFVKKLTDKLIICGNKVIIYYNFVYCLFSAYKRYYKQKIINIISWIKKNKIWLIIMINICLCSLTILFVNDYKLKSKINNLTSQNQELKLKIVQLEYDLDCEKTNRRVEIKMITDKVEALYNFTKRLYPGFDYKKKIKNAIDDPKKTNDLPEDLYNIYINEKIKVHGLAKYKKTLPDIEWPMDEKTSYIAVKGGEYGTYRPYRTYNFSHEGFDPVNPYKNSVKAIYDSFVWKKYYSYEGGWTVEIKFQYLNKEGEKEWYFARYRHLKNLDNYVEKGTVLKKGDIIGNMGDTGLYATTPHLHIELWKWEHNRWININFVQNSTWQNKFIERL